MFFPLSHLGVIFSQFTKLTEKEKGSAFLTPEQKAWVAIQEAVFRLKPQEAVNLAEMNATRRWIYEIVMHRFFDYAVFLLIIANCLMLSLW